MNHTVKIERRRKPRPPLKPYIVTKKINRRLFTESGWNDFRAMLNKYKKR
jgi:hypothetical protein